MTTSSLRFAGDFPPILVALAALLGALFVLWVYAKETRGLDLPYSYLLPALRASAVALAILLLAGPVIHRTRVVGTLGRVVFALDASQSMGVTDSSDAETRPLRIERAASKLTGDGQSVGWLESLRQTHLVDVIAFSQGSPSTVWSSTDESETPNSLEVVADGQVTELAAALKTMLGSTESVELGDPADDQGSRAAIVLMTDGRDNSGNSAMLVAEQLKAAGVQVHAIGVGSSDEPDDVGVVSISRPENVASDGRLSGTLVMKQQGLVGDQMKVRIEAGGKTFWEKTIPVTAAAQREIPFELDVEPIVQQMEGDIPRGVRRSSVVMDLKAVVEPLVGDSTQENNQMAFRVAASTRDRRLLILDGSSRWETRYLRNLFGRDPAWQVDTVLFGLGTDMPTLDRGDKRGEFPDSRDAMAVYDAIILGEVPPDQITEQDAFLIREFVTRGGGLIVVDGRYDRIRELARGFLADLVPVRYEQGEAAIEVQTVRPTAMGLDHPVMNLWGDQDELAEFWKELPNPQTASRVQPQEGTEVWANSVGVDGRQSPWLATRLYGAGRVFYLSSDQTWRWRYKVADRFHARFWNQLVAAVMQPPYAASDNYVALGTDKIEYDAGEASTVRVRLQDTSGKPVGDATVDALLIADDKIVATVPLNLHDPARGTYQGQTPPLGAGSYEVRVRASGFDAAALQASTPIWVGQAENLERQRISLDQDALLQLTEAGAGIYVHESSSEKILEAIKPLSRGRLEEADIHLWQSYYWFGAVILLLGIEWWLRKRAGLV